MTLALAILEGLGLALLLLVFSIIVTCAGLASRSGDPLGQTIKDYLISFRSRWKHPDVYGIYGLLLFGWIMFSGMQYNRITDKINEDLLIELCNKEPIHRTVKVGRGVECSDSVAHNIANDKRLAAIEEIKAATLTLEQLKERHK